MTVAEVTVVEGTFFSKNNLTPPKPMRFLRAAFRDLAMFQEGLPVCQEDLPVYQEGLPVSGVRKV